MLLLVKLFAIVVAVLWSAVVVALANRARSTTRRHVAQCTKMALEVSVSLARCKKLELQVVELDDLCQSLTASMHKLRSRAGMRELRERNEYVNQNLTGAAWKDAMRKQMRPVLVAGAPSSEKSEKDSAS
jgi:hypothetical protein